MKRNCVVLGVALALAMTAAFATPAQALVPDGSQGWFWQMPQPAGGIAGLSALAFPDAGNLWAVGAGGLILHSSDGGTAWAIQPTGTDAYLWSVSFPDDRHGWACGGPAAGTGGVILATSDGGASWLDKTPAGLKGTLINASFVDAHHGWIGMSDGDILKTATGGDAWQTLRPSFAAMAAMNGYLTIDFVDAGHGWAGVGSQIWMTVNGGKSWMPMSSGLTPDMLVTKIDFVDPIHGWALAQSQDTGASQVITTSDGGLSWRTISIGGSAVGDLDATSASSVYLLAGGRLGFAGFYDFFGYFGVGGVGQVIVKHSSDGGAHWRSSSVGSPFSVGALAASGKVVCTVGDGILTSRDAGRTWQSATSGQEYEFTAATALSPSNIWAVDASGALLHSSDGSHWVEQASPTRWTNLLYGVSFPDSSDGWVVGSAGSFFSGGVILHTSDGGRSWSPQASNLSGELVGVDFIDDLNGWAISNMDFPFGGVGAPLTVEHTTDGGVTWVPQYVYDNANLYAVDFISPTTGWASGDYQPSENSNGLPGIFATTDGGSTWTKERLPAGAPDMTGLQFLDASNGWAVGTSYDENENPLRGWALHTSDGGKTWTSVTGLADSLAETVHFSDPSDGWVGGLNGVYATTDGGATWQQVAGGAGVTAIAATDSDHVWAFGDGFLVSTLDASGDTAAPVTLADHSDGWHHKPVTVKLSANDVGGSGVKSTAYSTDGGATWQTGTSVAVDAPSDHSNDGEHAILYRSTDNAGNQEQTESLDLGIDTLGPACSAPRRSVADAGKLGTLYFTADDATSGVAKATITIVNSHGRVLRRFVERPGNWQWSPVPPYFYLHFKCTLKPGTYRVEVRATDWAGNPQVLVGRNRLRVVRHGAPVFHYPGWPAGLPWSSMSFSSLLGHSLEAQRLLRLRSLLPEAWRVRLLAQAGRLQR